MRGFAVVSAVLCTLIPVRGADSVPCPTSEGEWSARAAKLEADNNDLRSTLERLDSALAALASRVDAMALPEGEVSDHSLGRSSGASHGRELLSHSGGAHTALTKDSVTTPLLNATQSAHVTDLYVSGRIVYQGYYMPRATTAVPSPFPTGLPSMDPSQGPTAKPTAHPTPRPTPEPTESFCVRAFANVAQAGNIAVCNWREDLTWAQSAARAYKVDGTCGVAAGGAPSAGCWRHCRVSEFTARKDSLAIPAAFADPGWVWGWGYVCAYWGGPNQCQVYDIASYVCKEPTGTCHSSEGGQVQALSTGPIIVPVGCANNAWTASSYCNALTAKQSYYCRGT